LGVRVPRRPMIQPKGASREHLTAISDDALFRALAALEPAPPRGRWTAGMTELDVRTSRPDQRISGAKHDWEIVVGLARHAQVTSKAKLFSGASAEYGGEPNAHVSLVDAGMPGMLPVINRFCVEQAIRTGLGLKAQINQRSRFDRKNYFYPDL